MTALRPCRGRSRPIDFARIARLALAQAPRLVAALLPGGRLMGHEWVCGNLHGEPGDSCRVNLRTGRWADFAGTERGGDLIALGAAVWRVRQFEAARRIAGMLGIEASSHGR